MTFLPGQFNMLYAFGVGEVPISICGDPGKSDETYLPLADKQNDAHRALCAPLENEYWREQCLEWDWSDAIIARKLAAVAEVIRQVDDGRGADVIALQEVENVGILERLRSEYLADLGYRPPILIEGQDDRGIDVAFLSRLEAVGEPRLHPISFPGAEEDRVADTRGILEATFRLPDGTLLTGFAVHFPAPYHPTEMRVAAYDSLNALHRAVSNNTTDRVVFAAGDFNTTSAEDDAENMLARFARPTWTVVHELGCGDCRGTQYYAPNDEWSFLDMILVSFADTPWRVRPGSVQIANGVPAQVRADGTPRRFEMPAGEGVSDPWPLVVTIESG